MSNINREETYCVKEKQYTKKINPIIKTSKNGNKYIQSTCLICGNKRSNFIKSLRGPSSPRAKPSQKSTNKQQKNNIKDFFYKKK